MRKSHKVQELEYNAGDYILREGAQCDALIIVKSGQIEISKTGKNKLKVPVGLVQSGEYLGEMALLSDRPHSANAVALTKTVVIKVPHRVIEDHLKSMPGWLVALTRGLVDKLSKTNDVLKRNGIIDETLATALKAIVSSQEAAKGNPEAPQPEAPSSEVHLAEKLAGLPPASPAASAVELTMDKKAA